MSQTLNTDKQNKEPLVSVIVPVYNVSLYLRESLDSIINQTYRNLEIIIIDDGSSDGSENICEEYRKLDSRVSVIHQVNGGIGIARNTGLDHMTGHYVVFLDPDDAYVQDSISRMVKAIQDYCADLVIGGFAVIKTKKKMDLVRSRILEKQIYETSILSSKDALNYRLANQINDYLWNKIYSRVLWNDLRFPKVQINEDTRVMYLIFEKAKRIVLIDDLLVLHRIRSGSISQTVSFFKIQNWLEAKRILGNYVEEHTPEIFSQEAMVQFREHELAERIIIYSRLKLWHAVRCRDYIRMLKEDIHAREKALGGSLQSSWTRLLYRLFDVCPIAVSPIVRLFGVLQFIRRVSGLRRKRGR